MYGAEAGAKKKNATITKATHASPNRINELVATRQAGTDYEQHKTRFGDRHQTC